MDSYLRPKILRRLITTFFLYLMKPWVAGRPGFAYPCERVHWTISLMSSS